MPITDFLPIAFGLLMALNRKTAARLHHEFQRELFPKWEQTFDPKLTAALFGIGGIVIAVLAAWHLLAS